jgi:hypothetical protein
VNRGKIVFVDQEASPKIEDQRSRLIVGLESARTLKFLELAAIETMVLAKGYVVAGGELQGKKWCGLKPLLATPQSCVYVRS